MIAIQKSRQRSPNRKQTQTDKAVRGQTTNVPAPVSGWIENQSIAAGAGFAARVMENFFPTQTGCRVRGGCAKVAQINAPVRSLFSYHGSGASHIFAATSNAIFDVSAFDPDNAPAASVSGQTSGLYSTAQIGTVGGQYLVAVNGSDTAQVFDGAAWSELDENSTPALTGIDTAHLSHVWVFKNRFWFIERNSQTAWYLPVDSVGGAVSDFSLAGVFQKGGSLVFGATWSADSGAGMDDRIAFFSDQGEVAIYEGTNPANAAGWGLVGVFDVSPPLGVNAAIKAGGDLLVATEAGLVPLSAVVSKDPAALDTAAVSMPIEPSWRREAKRWLHTVPWEVHKWPQENMLLVVTPTSDRTMFVANIDTGAWAKYTGWDVQTACLHNRLVYFGSEDGGIYQAERTGSDNGTGYLARLSMFPADLGSPGAHKSVSAARGVFLSSTRFHPQLSVSANYHLNFPAAPDAEQNPATAQALWDVGIWDVSKWDENNSFEDLKDTRVTRWVAQGTAGYAIAPQVQITSDSSQRPDVELLSVDLLFETGGVVV